MILICHTDTGCVSMEAGVESITEEGRALLKKNSRLDMNQISDKLIPARRQIPFVQASLIESGIDETEESRNMGTRASSAKRSGTDPRITESL